MQLKTRLRESEIDILWSLHNVDLTQVKHFSVSTAVEHDVSPLLELINDWQPQVILLPDIPLSIIAKQTKILKLSLQGVKIWGYRSADNSYTISEADIIIPVAAEVSPQNKLFLSCFSSQQRSVRTLQLQQQEPGAQLKKLLGDSFFSVHSNGKMSAAAGFILLKNLNKQLMVYS